MRHRPRGVFMLLIAAALAPAPTTAWAHGAMEGNPAEGEGQAPGVPPGMELERPRLELQLPEHAELGEIVKISATLTDPHDGAPIAGVQVIFEAPAYWGEETNGLMIIGAAMTDDSGTATIDYRSRSAGHIEIEAAFQGAGGFAPVEGHAEVEVEGSRQLYSSNAGIRVPGLNLWLLAAVIALVWSLYLVVGARLIAIARSGAETEKAAVVAAEGVHIARDGGGVTRRQFIGRLFPYGAQVGIAAFGVGLVGVVERSPRTHGNLMAPPATKGYERTAIAHVGQMTEMREMPMPLDREMSFEADVLPILLAFGGPHALLPEHSPPPGTLRLDSYEGLMAKEGVVVPGEPEESEIVEHLLATGMQMPPSGPPLPDAMIQTIVTWIAQGAKDN